MNARKPLKNKRFISIAEAVGDDRISRYRCHLCKENFFHTTMITGSAGYKFCARCRGIWVSKQRSAKRIVKLAVKAGFLPPAKNLPCADCGDPAIGYEHRWYCRPLDVDPICDRCNRRRGPAFDSFGGVAT